MGYMVKRDETIYGHYETKRAAYDAIKDNICEGTMPLLVHTSPEGIERFEWRAGIIYVVPDPGML